MSIVTVQERFLLTKPGSTKRTYHVVLGLKNVDLSFEVGDSVAVHAHNDPVLVDKFLRDFGVSGEELIMDARSGQEIEVKNFLMHKANLSKHGILDPQRMTLQELCTQFSPLLPRFYSIASSPKYHPNEMHLTVALLTFMHQGEERNGVASYFLSHLAKEGVTPVPIYVQKARHFKLPDDPSADLIMIGPGTGVAPFRAFMQEREKVGAFGKHWLFFGERHREYDFFYEDYWMELASRGRLRVDVAFSRDQLEKVYVQDKMYAQKIELWDWIQKGSYIYVCGDATRMAKDVDATLHRIAEDVGGLSPEAARGFFRQMRKDKRYLCDVY